MYTSQKNLLILISLLKQYGIRKLVLSPGTRNSPFCHSVENDSDFTCYSIVDERSAAYFALGIAESSGEPVAFSCTSSTAACNYMPAIKEAYEKKIPLLALTGDREYFKLYQMEDQMIDQENMYSPYINYYCSLPMVYNSDIEWYCTRKVNEALYSLKKGPVQINFQVSEISFPVKKLPIARKIIVHETFDYEEVLKRLISKKRILVICGQNYPYSLDLSSLLRKFAEKYNSVVSADYFSNLQNDSYLRTVLVTEAMFSNPDEFAPFVPDLVITIGNHFWSFIKYSLRNNSDKFEHWRVAEDGIMMDGFRALTDVFKCSAEAFFQEVNKTDHVSDNRYYNLWKNRISNIKLPAFQFSNFSVIRDVVKLLPENAIVHTSILNSTRLLNYSEMSDSITSYSNLGADGIDGCLSSFLGETYDVAGLNFLITGDLSLMYDMNVLDKSLMPSHRILAINNYAGSEFHLLFSRFSVPTLDLHIAAGHHTKLKDVVSISSNVKYLSATNQNELEKAIPLFLENSGYPIVFEVFTDADTDAYMLKLFYAMNLGFKNRAKGLFKQKIKNYLLKYKKKR